MDDDVPPYRDDIDKSTPQGRGIQADLLRAWRQRRAVKAAVEAQRAPPKFGQGMTLTILNYLQNKAAQGLYEFPETIRHRNEAKRLADEERGRRGSGRGQGRGQGRGSGQEL